MDRDFEQRRFHALIDHPEAFDTAAFEAEVERFGERLSRDDVVALIERRLQAMPAGLDRNAVLAVMEGRTAEAQRLTRLLQRREQLGLSVADGPAAPRRSS